MNRLAGFRLLVTAAGLALGACASSPEIDAYADGDPRSARLLLEQVNGERAMPVVIEGPIAGGLSAPAVAEALGADVFGTSAKFAAQSDAPGDGPRVLVLFGPPDQMSPWRACDPAGTTGSGFGDGRRVAALVCDGPSTVAHVRGSAVTTSADDVTALLRRMGESLFPDPYAERYRYDRYGGYGGYGSFGGYGSNLGIGLGFGFGF